MGTHDNVSVPPDNMGWHFFFSLSFTSTEKSVPVCATFPQSSTLK